MICNTTAEWSKITYANITVNTTKAMLQGKFWQQNEFYNHTGVDYVLTL